MNGKEIINIMRTNKTTIRDLAKRTGITMKRIRQVRVSGLYCRLALRDWVQAITGTDPGRM